MNNNVIAFTQNNIMGSRRDFGSGKILKTVSFFFYHYMLLYTFKPRCFFFFNYYFLFISMYRSISCNQNTVPATYVIIQVQVKFNGYFVREIFFSRCQCCRDIFALTQYIFNYTVINKSHHSNAVVFTFYVNEIYKIVHVLYTVGFRLNPRFLTRVKCVSDIFEKFNNFYSIYCSYIFVQINNRVKIKLIDQF